MKSKTFVNISIVLGVAIAVFMFFTRHQSQEQSTIVAQSQPAQIVSQQSSSGSMPDQEMAKNKLPSALGRYSSGERRMIFIELTKAEERGLDEADASYQGGDRVLTPQQSDDEQKLADRLSNKYVQQVQDKYHLTDDELTAITNEGTDEHWPNALMRNFKD